MRRVVGKRALNFEIVDIAADPNSQGRWLGRTIMEHILSWLRKRELGRTLYYPRGGVAGVRKLNETFGLKKSCPQAKRWR